MAKELKGEKRSKPGSREALKLRREGRIPAVVYGGGQPATMIAVSEHEFSSLIHSGERVVILKIEGQEKQALIKDICYDALGERMLHVDFNELKAGQTVRVRVPVVVKGVPKGSADGGILSHVLHEIEVECLPTAIPDKITLDVEPLIMGQAVHVAELHIPAGVKVLTKGTDVVAACVEPRKEEEAAAPAEGGALEPEVISEKKEEGAEAAGEEEKEKEKKPAAEAKKPEAKKPEAKK